MDRLLSSGVAMLPNSHSTVDSSLADVVDVEDMVLMIEVDEVAV